MLDSLGYFFQFENSGLKIMKWTEIVIKGVKENCLYILQGLSVPALVGVSIVSEEDRTKLWHLRLCYISVKGIQ